MVSPVIHSASEKRETQPPVRRLGLPDATERRLRDHLFLKIASRNSHGVKAFSFNPAWIDRVDADFSWS